MGTVPNPDWGKFLLGGRRIYPEPLGKRKIVNVKFKITKK
jgi:hypothetical protein